MTLQLVYIWRYWSDCIISRNELGFFPIVYWKIALFFLFDTHIGSSKHIIKKKSSLPIVFDGDDDAQKYWRMNNCQVARQNYERSIRIKMASSFFKASSSWMCQQIVWSFVEGVADMSTGIKFNSNRSTLKRQFFCYCCCCCILWLTTKINGFMFEMIKENTNSR